MLGRRPLEAAGRVKYTPLKYSNDSHFNFGACFSTDGAGGRA
ncbi:hypothetical protein KGM_200104 [Danaus plexippus plexippus]|uniref:Uncharacterized protein n=1 Tax=Danaus plexippus plexippus TaxID=278856 RepID=A0A212FK86_DANPL|nr:hypothetical protein KGM_200104 [Danaus plexippus plexippus]